MTHPNPTPLPQSSDTPLGCVLAIEDDNTTRTILTGLLEDLGYQTLEAENGKMALDIAGREQANIDVIILDKMMPEMDGLEVMKNLREMPGCDKIPVIMVTGSSEPEEIKEGIDAGVFYYLTKPYEDGVFQSVLTSAMNEAKRLQDLKTELRKHQTSFTFIDKASFTIQKLNEAEDLACFLAACFPSPETALPGLANLLTNAVEHGNLDIGYHEKSNLLEQGTWRQEVEERQSKPEYRDKTVRVEFVRNDEEMRVTIADDGNGFDWQKYLEIDPARALDNNGRGIAQANQISFDDLIYNSSGNEVTAVSRTGSTIKW